jgi:hypothetical protein
MKAIDVGAGCKCEAVIAKQGDGLMQGSVNSSEDKG